MTTTSSTLSSSDLGTSLDLIEVKPGLKFSRKILVDLLPDVETALFFSKVYDLDYTQVSSLLHTVCNSPLADALFSGDHSTELQDYLVELASHLPDWEEGEVTTNPNVPHGEILPELWKQLEVDVAQSIKDVAAKLEGVVAHLPGKQGSMVFQSMLKLNAKRPTLGDYRARIHHERQQQNLLILDVSGSMSSNTIAAIVEDVVALSYTANAHLAIVSDSVTYWEPGCYDVNSVLDNAEYSGTHYEMLTDVLDMDWGTVITVADYDSSYGAKEAVASCTGRIDTVIDVSLVGRPTFLAECVGQLASEVRPILVAQSNLTRSAY